MTYYEWIDYFNKQRNAPINDEIINKINNSNIDYLGNMKVRYLNQIVKLINYRLNNSLDKFLINCKRLSQDKNTLMLEINSLKQEIVFAKKLASTKYFEENTKNSLISNINSFAEEMNESIKKSFSGTNDSEIMIIINSLDFTS